MPCKSLDANGLCGDVLSQLDKPVSKQEYNDKLDNSLFEYFGFSPGKIMTMREYCRLINSFLPGIEKICTHPGENREQRLENLKRGIAKFNL